MSKSVNILEVLEKAHQSVASVSKRNKQAIIDSYGRALTMKKVIDDFIKVNRNLIIDMGIGENANLLHGKDYSLHVSQKLALRLTRVWLKKNLASWNTINAKCQRNINKYKRCLKKRQQFAEIKSQQLKKLQTLE
tara:strand:- start:652 stop:1056 length:405 start_codon:yes stop_codon:yes gene_type:complete